MTAAAVVTVICSVADNSFGLTVAVFILLFASLLTLAVDSFRKRQSGRAFDFENAGGMKTVSYLCAAAFVAETVSNVLKLYGYYTSDIIIKGRAVLLVFIAVTSLLSAFLFVLVAKSYGNTNYEFTRIPALCFAPLVWSLVKTAQHLGDELITTNDISSVIKTVLITTLMLFFYSFAAETKKVGTASAGTVFFSGAAFVTGALYFVSRLALCLAQRSEVVTFENAFSLTALIIGVFALIFRNNIIKTTTV